MSSNKTEHFGLHAWAPEDPFLREEFNENFSRLDGAARVTAGSYTGDGRDGRVISLGFTPSAVFVTTTRAELSTGSYTFGGLACQGCPSTGLEIVEGGFQLTETDGTHLNYKSDYTARVYNYIAVR